MYLRQHSLLAAWLGFTHAAPNHNDTVVHKGPIRTHDGSIRCDGICAQRLFFQTAYASAAQAVTESLIALNATDYCTGSGNVLWCPDTMNSTIAAIAGDATKVATTITVNITNCDDLCLAKGLERVTTWAGYDAMVWAFQNFNENVTGVAVDEAEKDDLLWTLWQLQQQVNQTFTIDQEDWKRAMNGSFKMSQPSSPPYPMSNSSHYSRPSGSVHVGSHVTGWATNASSIRAQPTSPLYQMGNFSQYGRSSASLHVDSPVTGWATNRSLTTAQPSSPPYPMENSSHYVRPSAGLNASLHFTDFQSASVICTHFMYGHPVFTTTRVTEDQPKKSQNPNPGNNDHNYDNNKPPKKDQNGIKEHDDDDDDHDLEKALAIGLGVGLPGLGAGVGLLRRILKGSEHMGLHGLDGSSDPVLGHRGIFGRLRKVFSGVKKVFHKPSWLKYMMDMGKLDKGERMKYSEWKARQEMPGEKKVPKGKPLKGNRPKWYKPRTPPKDWRPPEKGCLKNRLEPFPEKPPPEPHPDDVQTKFYSSERITQARGWPGLTVQDTLERIYDEENVKNPGEIVLKEALDDETGESRPARRTTAKEMLERGYKPFRILDTDGSYIEYPQGSGEGVEGEPRITWHRLEDVKPIKGRWENAGAYLVETNEDGSLALDSQGDPVLRGVKPPVMYSAELTLEYDRDINFNEEVKFEIFDRNGRKVKDAKGSEHLITFRPDTWATQGPTGELRDWSKDEWEHVKEGKKPLRPYYKRPPSEPDDPAEDAPDDDDPDDDYPDDDDSDDDDSDGSYHRAETCSEDPNNTYGPGDQTSYCDPYERNKGGNDGANDEDHTTTRPTRTNPTLWGPHSAPEYHTTYEPPKQTSPDHRTQNRPNPKVAATVTVSSVSTVTLSFVSTMTLSYVSTRTLSFVSTVTVSATPIPSNEPEVDNIYEYLPDECRQDVYDSWCEPFRQCAEHQDGDINISCQDTWKESKYCNDLFCPVLYNGWKNPDTHYDFVALSESDYDCSVGNIMSNRGEKINFRCSEKIKAIFDGTALVSDWDKETRVNYDWTEPIRKKCHIPFFAIWCLWKHYY